jgi:UDP-glucose 4-epimerase
MSDVVLITGVSRYLGGRLAARLAADPSIERVIGIDTTAPRGAHIVAIGRTEFVRADIRNPLIAKVLAQARVSTVVHAGLLNSPRGAGGRVPMQELNVIGTMQLLGACQRSDTVARVVVASTAAVYGSGSRQPAVFTETMHPGESVRSGYARDAIEVEGYVRGFGRRRPGVTTTVLRFGNTIGPTIDTALTRYLAGPIVPTVLGYDPRLQLLHEADAVETIRRATVQDRPGVFNVAGDGVLTLSQVLRRLGRIRLPVAPRALMLTRSALRTRGLSELLSEQPRLLWHGRVLDTQRLRTEFGYTPEYSTADALDSYGAADRLSA